MISSHNLQAVMKDLVFLSSHMVSITDSASHNFTTSWHNAEIRSYLNVAAINKMCTVCVINSESVNLLKGEYI